MNHPPNDSDPRPTISLFEQWEEGAHVPKGPKLPMQGTILSLGHLWYHTPGCMLHKPCLRNIREGDDDAVKASSEWKDQWW